MGGAGGGAAGAGGQGLERVGEEAGAEERSGVCAVFDRTARRRAYEILDEVGGLRH